MRVYYTKKRMYPARGYFALGLHDRNDPAVLDELDLAVLQREEREVAALADVLAGMDLRAALADDDGACLEKLPVVGLDAKVLRVGVAAVAGRC